MTCVLHSMLQLSLERVFVSVRVYGVQRAMECSQNGDQAIEWTAEEFWFDSCLVQEILSFPKHPYWLWGPLTGAVGSIPRGKANGARI